jgi:DNA-binding CsgD family transcriptional regulator
MSRILISEIRAMLELHLSASQIARRLSINIEEVKLAISAIKSY